MHLVKEMLLLILFLNSDTLMSLFKSLFLKVDNSYKWRIFDLTY
jgi:hypothetical protein